MDLINRVVVVTGGGRGIGRAMCHRFAQEKPRQIIVIDLSEDHARQVASEIGGIGFQCDVTDEANFTRLLEQIRQDHGTIDVFIGNAGTTFQGGLETTNRSFQSLWELHVLAHVYAARTVIPSMAARKEGYFLLTSSAAGVLTEVSSVSYTVTKHATVALAEWLSVQYRRQGVRVSCLCPAGVQTDLLNTTNPVHRFMQVHALSPEEVAEVTYQGIQNENFLILPHQEVAEFMAFKALDYDRWLHNFSRMKEKWDRQLERMPNPDENG